MPTSTLDLFGVSEEPQQDRPRARSRRASTEVAVADSVFTADPEGFREQNAGREPAQLVRELLQNALDEGAKNIDITVAWRPDDGGVVVEVTDDVAGGVPDPALIFTIWKTSKQDSPQKRGRLGRGMKELIAVADLSVVNTVGWAVEFARDDSGKWRRAMLSIPHPEVGTKITASLGLWKEAAIGPIVAYLNRVHPPAGCKLVVNGQQVAPRPALESYDLSLPTIMYESSGGERVSRVRIRTAPVVLFEEPEAWVYEMGLPIERIDYPCSIDVGQRVPLREQRDTLTDPYRRELFAKLVSLRIHQLPRDNFRDKFVLDAAASPQHLSPEAKTAIAEAWTEGQPFAASPEAMKQATGAHIHVVSLRTLPESIRNVVKEAGTNVATVLSERKAAACMTVPAKEQTAPERTTIAVFEWIAAKVGRKCAVAVSTGRAGAAADFSREANVLTLYREVLGARWFDRPLSGPQLGLLIHELAHWKRHGEDEHGMHFHSDAEDVGGAVAAFLLENAEEAKRKAVGR